MIPNKDETSYNEDDEQVGRSTSDLYLFSSLSRLNIDRVNLVRHTVIAPNLIQMVVDVIDASIVERYEHRLRVYFPRNNHTKFPHYKIIQFRSRYSPHMSRLLFYFLPLAVGKARILYVGNDTLAIYR